FADLYWWLRDSGLSLDPKAALSSSIKPFVPQFLGTGKIAQFQTNASLGLGAYLSLLSLLVSFSFCCERLRPRRSRRPLPAGAAAQPSAVALAVAVALVLTGRPLPADTIVVQPRGPVGSLADALDRASKGDTIIVRGGTHPGPVIVRKSVRLVGED